MAVKWIFSINSKSENEAAITGQLVNLYNNTLCLRNPWVTDSVFMGKIYTALILGGMITIYPELLSIKLLNIDALDLAFIAMMTISPLIFLPFLLYRIYFIRNLSGFYFNCSTKKIYYQRGKKLITFNWKNLYGGVFQRTEFGGSSFSTSYALAFAPPREDGSLHQKDCLWVDSNEPTESGIKHVAEVWEYLRHFMNHGP
ncbi:hypothetical protein, partial [Pseudomonas entomophila]|uniref:hypothetical protein n=1 Tax=Pseudomonas entomophila TaxID=312306 RepID=UPI001EFFD842